MDDTLLQRRAEMLVIQHDTYLPQPATPERLQPIIDQFETMMNCDRDIAEEHIMRAVFRLRSTVANRRN